MKTNNENGTNNRAHLTRYAWLSIAAACLTIGMKSAAYFLTGSVGLLSDALESLVNLAGAVMALAMLTIAARPADEDHAYGHTKAEYFSSGFEGALILVAAVMITVTAVRRLISPEPLEQVGLGLVISIAASLVNLGVALVMLPAAKRYNSITLEADARHLLTDVWTSVGVIIGVALVAITGWLRLDPLVALIVAANIIWTGVRIIRKSIRGLMDIAIPIEEQDALRKVLEPYEQTGVQFHALRTRQSASRRFISFHVLVPGEWSVHQGHQLLENIEADIRNAIPEVTVFTHLESLEDPASWNDSALDRTQPALADNPAGQSEGALHADNPIS
jgi:cation diffusion facilitator family transporter